jgi:signal recognition particle receptor subunit beta
MNAVESRSGSGLGTARFGLALRAETLRDEVRRQAVSNGRDDQVTVLDAIPEIAADRPVRVIVAGSLKRGKSTLVNTLVGRPLLSPVGIGITTACWVEIGYGDQDAATALLADARSPGEPVRRAIEIADVERYVALDSVTEPVLGVEVRIRSVFLRDLMLVDTPGVGGLDTGHSQTTLTALRQADALLFVSDCTQPILAPEVDFLAMAAQQVATVVVAVSKSDIPGCEVVVRETCERLATRPELAQVPVFPVSPPLSDRVTEVDSEKLAERLAQLSGVAPLTAALRSRTAVGRESLRIANTALTTASVARTLARRLDEQAADPLGTHGRAAALEADESRLAAMLADRSLLSVVIAARLLRLRTEPRDLFAARTRALRQKYQDLAQRGPAAQLETLAARMAADLTASCVDALDLAVAQGEQLVREILDQAGASWIAMDLSARKPSGVDLGLAEPDLGPPGLSSGLAAAGSLFPTVFKLLAGSAVVVSVLTGPGAIAASVAVAACAGWWRARGGAEQERRAQLRAWVNSAADQASATFGSEMDRRVTSLQQFLDGALPGVLDALRADLARVKRELGDLREASAGAQRQAQARLVVARDLLLAQADQAVEVARVATATVGTGVAQ